MPTERERRLALNEAAFRVANERMGAWEERHGRGDAEFYLCECANPECREHVLLTRSEYDAVRADSRHFVITHGHEIPDVETVVERTDNYAVIEKDPNVDPITEGTDPRRDG